MGLLSDSIYVFIKTNAAYKKYKKMGYNAKIGESVLINLSDIPKGCRDKVKVQCDICGKIFEMQYRSYNVNKNYPNVICLKCSYNEKVETYKERYGVENPMQLEENKEKARNTMIAKYGESSPMKVQSIKEKYENTCLEKYGTRYAIENFDIREKAKKTNIEKYGVNFYLESDVSRQIALERLRDKYKIQKSPFENINIREKAKKTIIKKYGVDNVFKLEDFREKSIKNKIEKYGKTIFTNIVSKPQIRICEILNGKLNEKIGKYFPDIIFNENIVCEYDGGGHTLSVKLNKISYEDFYKKESEREDFFINNGYKILRIINKKDKLFNENDIIYIKNEALKYFNIGINVFKYDIETNQYTYR